MNIEHLLREASWRVRAFLGAPQTDPARVGWRQDSTCCPLAEWLAYEYLQATGRFPPMIISVDAESIIVGQQMLATPPMLSTFIDLVDSASLAPDTWMARDARVTAREAEAALVEAERRSACRLLPEQTASVPRCAYVERGRRCEMPASTPVVHGFFQYNCYSPGEQLCRQNCIPFIGGVCAKHWLQVVVPPASWWPREAVEPEREAALLG